MLTEENAKLEVFVRETQSSGQKEVTEDNLDSLVYPSDPFSAKYAYLVLNLIE